MQKSDKRSNGACAIFSTTMLLNLGIKKRILCQFQAFIFRLILILGVFNVKCFLWLKCKKYACANFRAFYRSLQNTLLRSPEISSSVVVASNSIRIISSKKLDLTRTCFQFWPIIGDKGDKISKE